MKEEIKKLKQQAENAKYLYKTNAIDRQTAKEEIMPYIEEYNEKSLEIAKKYNQKAKKLTFASFVR